MRDAKVLKNENGIITVGFQDDKSIKVYDAEIDAPVGSIVDVYTQEDGSTLLVPHEELSSSYQYHAGAEAVKGFGGRVADEFKGDHRVSKTAYILLALFLGNLGIHKFYAKKYIMGLVYLLFCWTFIPCIIALVEAILAIFKPCDRNGDILV